MDREPESSGQLLEAESPHTYYGTSHILHGVDFAVAPGETIGLLGRNGMGKTTLLRSLLGLTRPRRGRVRLRGADVTRARPHRSRAPGSPMCPRAAASSPISACAKTW